MSDSKVFMFPDSPCQATNGTDQISTLNNKVSNMEDILNKIVNMLSDSTKH